MEPGPVVVITGGSAGARRAAARAFAQKGFRVGLLARGLERLEAAGLEVDEPPRVQQSLRGSRHGSQTPPNDHREASGTLRTSRLPERCRS
jgi:NAD(P)-dependent dehydrogenase (short-subunit alcohol dehydrogenase family)